MLKQSLNTAFKALRKEGYFARQSFMCCSTCAWCEVPAKSRSKAVFYHQQDATQLKAGKGVWLTWSGDGAYIVKTLTDAGVKVDWDGTILHRIFCNPD